ncbi:MAG: DUF2306 domain-containing protein [Terracidiphilus sp.]
MATITQLAPSYTRSRFKTILWILLGITTLFVLITSEVFLAADYPMYRAYRLQVIADRHLLIPHVLAGTIALLSGPIQFSSRFRERHLKIHRVMGRIYVFCVFIGAFTGIALAAGRPGLPGTTMQAAAWIVCTTAAFITRAQPPNRGASPVDGPVICSYIYLRLKPGAQPVAPLLEPSWGRVRSCGRYRIHARVTACGRSGTELARTNHPPCLIWEALSSLRLTIHFLGASKPKRWTTSIPKR